MKRIVLLTSLLMGSLFSNGQSFTTGNIAVLSVGNGNTNLNASAQAVTIVEYTADGKRTNTTISIPNTEEGKRLVLLPTANLEGGLSLSFNGQYLVFGGYDAAIGTNLPNTQGTTGVNSTKVLARVSAKGVVDLSTKFTVEGSNSIRSVVSDGNNFWVASANAAFGVAYVPFGSNTYTQVNKASYRSIGIADGQLYGLSGLLATIGTGLPQTDATISKRSALGTINPYGFVLFDLSETEPGLDVMYIADQSGTAGLRKFSKVAGVWKENGALDVTSFANAPANNPGSLLGITGSLNRAKQPVLYATRGTGDNNALISITDATGYNVSINETATFNHLANAGSKFTFKGVALTPSTNSK